LNSAVGSVDMPDLHILQSDTPAGEWRSIPRDGSGMSAAGARQMQTGQSPPVQIRIS
jgi:hypothetical protein